ncbi:MAG: hypothetical protein ABFQ82_03420 [Thermodesulfobacteriota bacterium]
MKKPISLVVVIFLSLVAVLHLLRLMFQVDVTIGGAIIPQWASMFGSLAPAGLAVMLKRESSR